MPAEADAAFLAAVLIYGTIGFYYLEDTTLFDAFYMTVITMTTVGYGDVYPITTGGRIFTGLVLLVGLGIVAVPTGLIATALTVTRSSASPRSSCH